MLSTALALLIALTAGSGVHAAEHLQPAPSAILGPDGPVFLGPLPDPADPRGRVVVDPRSGGLYVQLPGQAGRFTWDGQGWWLDGVRLVGPDRREGRPLVDGERPGRVPEGVRWEWGEEGLRAIVDPRGGRVRITADDRGAPVVIEWPDGNRLAVVRDGFSRVTRITGPGTGVLRYRWQDGGVEATDPAGRPLSIRPRQGTGGAVSMLEVTDALGRRARTLLDADGGLVGWADPRGLETRLQRQGDLLVVVDGLGRTWRVHAAPSGRVDAVDVPGQGRWTWRLGHLDQLLSIEDPAGRIHAWSEDRPGRLAATGRGPASWRVRRDPAGRVTSIIDPTGAITELQRDGAGRVVRIVDPLGNSLALKRDSAGEIVEIDGPDEARWRLERDIFGRLTRVDDPAGTRVTLRRDAAGRLVAVHDERRGRFELSVGLDGQLSRIRAPTGEQLALERDGLGRVAVIRNAAGEAVRIRRDILGEPVELQSEGAVVRVQRDPGGQPTAAGEVRWRRDAAGRVSAIEAPGHRVDLRYDPAGALRQARAGDWWVDLQRDAAGRVVRWQGSDGEVQVRRDLVGRVVEEQVILPELPLADPLADPPADPAVEAGPGRGIEGPLAGHGAGARADRGAGEGPPLALARDPAGRIRRVGVGGAEWRFMRGADGRLLRLQGPGGVGVGMDRDDAGRVVLLRLPRGGLIRRSFLDDGEALSLRGSDGRELDTRILRRDGLDRVVEIDDGPSGGQRWRRDPTGALVLVEETTGEAWSWTPGGVRGAGGESLEFDALGRLAAARPPVGPPAWWVGSAVLSYAWSEEGPLRWIAGELGAVELHLDALGRLRTVAAETGLVRRLRYDARGRLSELWRGDRREQRLAWAPGDAGQPARLLASGPSGEDTWTWSDWGPVAVTDDAGLHELVLDSMRRVWWSIDPAGMALRHSPRLRGYPELVSGSRSLDLVGPSGMLRLGAEGPLIVPRPAEGGAVPAGLALDPLSGQRVDGLRPFPWQVADLFEGLAVDPLDPRPWRPAAPWDEPLRLLQAMGELQAPVSGEFLSMPAPPPDLAGLPGGLSSLRPPLGPALDALPVELDPLTAAALRSCLPGGSPLEADAIIAVQLREELDLPWLPPGLAVPLPDAWRSER